MAKTPSTMIPLGTIAPEFSLLEVVSGEHVSFADLKSDRATVVMFVCNHCPYVIRIQDHLAEFAKNYQKKGVSFIAISSNDAEQYPADGPDEMKKRAEEKQFSFPYLYDQTQEVARAYQAACTPDFFVFDSESRVAYRGQYDESRRDDGTEVTGSDLAQALDCLLAGSPVSKEQTPSLGCNIKWKS